MKLEREEKGNPVAIPQYEGEREVKGNPGAIPQNEKEREEKGNPAAILQYMKGNPAAILQYMKGNPAAPAFCIVSELRNALSMPYLPLPYIQPTQ